MKGPLVSVLMPVYNAEKFVEKAVDSIFSQTYPYWELLICDDASTDRSYDRVKSAISSCQDNVRLFQNSTNLKLLKTRNFLLKEATGDLITFQDADDVSDPFRLEKMVKEFQSNSKLGLLATQVGYVNEKGKLLRVSSKPTDYRGVMELIYTQNVVGGSFMMITKEALLSVGAHFRTYFDGLSYQDYDLSLLIAQRYECYSLRDVLYYYRQHPNSTSKIISADRLLARKIVIRLAEQRRTRGSDDLMDSHPERVDEYFDELRRPYVDDRARLYREYAGDFLYNHLYLRSIRSAWLAVNVRPLSIVNWRTLQYCVRKSIIAAWRNILADNPTD